VHGALLYGHGSGGDQVFEKQNGSNVKRQFRVSSVRTRTVKRKKKTDKEGEGFCVEKGEIR